MGHVINHDDLTTRVWICTKCGCKCLSKNPWLRNTHGESPGGMELAMYLGYLQRISLAKRVPAHPPRPKETEMVYGWSSDEAFCLLDNEHDIAIYITPDRDVSDTGKPIRSDAEELLKFFKFIRETDERVLKNYACAQFGGHEWTDDPALIGKENGDVA
jgi:hypothetical protein